jgi:hypothetical protein
MKLMFEMVEYSFHDIRAQNAISTLKSVLTDFFSLLDLIFGFRAFGLILFALLPSNLALIGSLEVKVGALDKIPPIIVVFSSLIPIMIIFLLIRSKHKEWYLDTSLLNVRSGAHTLVILILSTAICGISGIINGRYTFEIQDIFLRLSNISFETFNTLEWNKCSPIIESFLLAVASLVLSSTLFLTILTKEGNFPLLPSAEFVESLKKVKMDIQKLQRDNIWKEAYTKVEDYDRLIKLSKGIIEELKKSGDLNFFAKGLLKSAEENMISFLESLDDIKDNCNGSGIRIKWGEYFKKNSKDKKLAYIEKVKKLKVGI